MSDIKNSDLVRLPLQGQRQKQEQATVTVSYDDAINDGTEEKEEKSRMNVQVTIETPRLVLRGVDEGDVDGLFECFGDEEAMRYWSTVPHANLQVTAEWVGKMRESTKNGVTDFVIELKASPSSFSSPIPPTTSTTSSTHQPCIGKVGTWDGNEIGFIIAQNYWRQGFANEAVTALLDYVFGVFKPVPSAVVEYLQPSEGANGKEECASLFEDVVADVDPRNHLSLKALERLGFGIYDRKERTFQVGDEWVDSVYLALKRDAWIERRR